MPLSRHARAVVEALPAPEFGSYVLLSLAGSQPISDFSGAKAKLDALIKANREAALTPWVVHDLRRSMATHMERLGIAPHIIEVCLGEPSDSCTSSAAAIAAERVFSFGNWPWSRRSRL